MEIYGRKGMFPEEYEKMFENIESALRVKLFIWQKSYIAYGEFRQYGATTAMILRELMMVNHPPLDFSQYSGNAELEHYRRNMREIKRRLDEAGVPTREIFFDRRQKEAYICSKKSESRVREGRAQKVEARPQLNYWKGFEI